MDARDSGCRHDRNMRDQGSKQPSRMQRTERGHSRSTGGRGSPQCVASTTAVPLPLARPARTSSRSCVRDARGPAPSHVPLQRGRGVDGPRSTRRSGARPSPLTPTTNSEPTARLFSVSNMYPPLFVRTRGLGRL